MPKAVPPSSPDGVPPEATLRTIRVPFIQRVEVVRQEGAVEYLFVIDLGMKGVFVERPEPLPVDERAQVRFTIPGNEIPLVANCRVAWWHPADAPLVSRPLPAGVGLQFLKLLEADRRRIRRHVVEYFRRQPKGRMFHQHPPLDDDEDGP